MYYYILICSRGAKISCGKFCKLLWGLAFSLPPGFARRLDYLTFLCGRFWLLAPDFWLLKAQPFGCGSAALRGRLSACGGLSVRPKSSRRGKICIVSSTGFSL